MGLGWARVGLGLVYGLFRVGVSRVGLGLGLRGACGLSCVQGLEGDHTLGPGWST